MFRLINRYLLREVIPYVLLAFLLLTAIIFAQQASRFSELLVVYSRTGLPMEGIYRILSALIPGIIVFTLPISLLVGVLVGLGRLSGDSEIVALGASGISRLQILKPIAGLGLVVGGAMLYLMFNVAPRAIHNLRDLKANQSILFQGLKTQIKPRVFDESFPQKVLYVESIDRTANRWHNIFLADLSDGPDDPKLMTAESGYLQQGEQQATQSDQNGGQSDSLELFLQNASLHQLTSQPDDKSSGKKDKKDKGKNSTGKNKPEAAKPAATNAGNEEQGQGGAEGVKASPSQSDAKLDSPKPKKKKLGRKTAAKNKAVPAPGPATSRTRANQSKGVQAKASPTAGKPGKSKKNKPSQVSDEQSKAVPVKTTSGSGDQNKSEQNYSVESSRDMTILIPVSQEKEAEDIGLNTDQEPISEMIWSRLINYSPSPREYRAWLAEVNSRIAFPSACLIFALLAVAFGISHVRTGRSFGLMLGLAITIAYYLLALSGKHNAVAGNVPVWFGIWQGNIFLGLLGLLVLWVERKPGFDPLSALGSLQHILRQKREHAATKKVAEADSDRSDSDSSVLSTQSQSGKTWQRGGTGHATPRAVRGFPGHRLIDRLVLSDLGRFFIYILAGFSALFLIITLFQLLDSITRNNIESSVVANYLVFLLPMIVNYMAPMAALVAVMVTYGILEKTSQVVVLKASGISIYRLAGPAIIASILLSGLVFLNQDYILPFTNRRQDNLYHLIRSGQEPAQTFYQTDHKWIFGGDSRIYNYAHFNPIDNSFAHLTILNLSKEPFSISSRVFAEQARWDEPTGRWILQKGWERKFKNTGNEYDPFRERSFQLPEGPDYFKRESKESSMMTLAELQNQIKTLSRSGFDVLDLKIDLYKKLAFPATCIIMMFVGLPFAFSVGKKGALYGVAIGIAIGLTYWGLLNLFEQMGRYEILPPLLAAWGPNMMFGAGGLYLFLTSRT